jgi:hypothetical protein
MLSYDMMLFICGRWFALLYIWVNPGCHRYDLRIFVLNKHVFISHVASTTTGTSLATQKT